MEKWKRNKKKREAIADLGLELGEFGGGFNLWWCCAHDHAFKGTFIYWRWLRM